MIPLRVKIEAPRQPFPLRWSGRVQQLVRPLDDLLQVERFLEDGAGLCSSQTRTCSASASRS